MTIYEPISVSENALFPASVDVSLEAYMEHYAAHHYEWVDGKAVKMSPVSGRHDDLVYYLRNLLTAYFSLRPLGKVRGDPFVMRLPKLDNKRREPDLQVILKTNPGNLTETLMDGPADICIEVVSLGSTATDYGDKFAEYEMGGVGEYWIIDHLRRETRFLRLNDENIYIEQALDGVNNYTTPLLPDFVVHIPTLWENDLPDILAVATNMKTLLDNLS